MAVMGGIVFPRFLDVFRHNWRHKDRRDYPIVSYTQKETDNRDYSIDKENIRWLANFLIFSEINVRIGGVGHYSELKFERYLVDDDRKIFWSELRHSREKVYPHVNFKNFFVFCPETQRAVVRDGWGFRYYALTHSGWPSATSYVASEIHNYPKKHGFLYSESI